MKAITFFGVSTALLLMLIPGLVFGEELSLTLNLPHAAEYTVTQTPLGQKIGFEECGYKVTAGSPMLPTKTVLVALPPGRRITSLDVRLTGLGEFAGTFRLCASPEPELLDGGVRRAAIQWESGQTLSSTGSSGQSYPIEPGWITATGGLGKYRYVAVTVCPCVYDSQSGKLRRYESAEITLTCEPDPTVGTESGTPGEVTWTREADDRAQQIFVNFEDIRGLYHAEDEQATSPLQTYDYVIITTSALSAAVTSSDFITWKTSLGYNVRIVLITDPEITSQPGGDLAEQIRNFLMAYYATWDIEYVLLVGNYATVPMRYCYPDPSNHTNTAGTPGGTGGEVPTDCYYADLSYPDAVSWDSDGDGYYGEYGEDAPDFMPEVYVGRIPTNLSGRITYALNKIVAFEQDTGAWKQNALHAGAFWYFTHELGDTIPAMDAAEFLSYIEADIMSGWTVTRYSEQTGLEVSAYAWPALTEAAFTGSWRTGQHAIVNWGAHGWTSYIARKIWDWDDGDGIPEAGEFTWPTIVSLASNLDDDYPSIVTATSCLVGCPEPNDYGNMGIKMLVLPGWGPAVAVVASARSPYATLNWPPGGSRSIIYEFNDLMIIDLEKVGQAFYNSKFYCTTNYGWASYKEYVNMYCFNLWGDPSLTREGIDIAGLMPGGEVGQATSRIQLLVGPTPTRRGVTSSYYLPCPAQPSLDIFDVHGRRVHSVELPHLGAGWHTASWDGSDEKGWRVSPGVYFYRLTAGPYTQTRRVVLIR